MKTTYGRPLRGGILSLVLLAAPGVATAEEVSLYERLGGLPAISLAVSLFVDDFVEDPMVMANPAVAERKSPEAAPYIKFQVTSLVCEMSGGPCQYTGLDMRQAHEGLGVSPQEWDRMAEIFVTTLDRLEVPDREQQELLEMLGGTRDDIVVATTP